MTVYLIASACAAVLAGLTLARTATRLDRVFPVHWYVVVVAAGLLWPVLSVIACGLIHESDPGEVDELLVAMHDRRAS